MTAEERLKVRDWARRNLGKEVTSDLKDQKVMVVGYSYTINNDVNVLTSMPNNRGWSHEYLDCSDQVLVHSPLNVSFWMVNLDDIEEYVEQG